MKGMITDLRQSYRGEWVLGIALDKESVPEAMRLFDKERMKPFEVVLKPFKEKRSLTANSYFHVLVNKLAAALRISNDECKKWLVSSYGTVAEANGYPVVITLPKGQNADDFYPYHSWIYGDATSDSYQLYKQTHSLNTKEFARLLDGTISECKEQGIETLSPAELERLYAQADKVKGNPEKR